MRNSAAQVVEEKGWLLNLEGLRLDDHLEVTRRINCGSYAEIYLARNAAPRTDEPDIVIVKALNLLLHGALESDLERTLIENIALEAQTMGSFNHEHIARLFGCGSALDDDGRQFYYLILEYLPGGSLAQFCRAQPLSYERTLDYTKQICAALSYAHAQGVLHRDIKPNNIMLSANRRTAKVLDFGTARLLHAAGSITKVGTDLYAAPEHFSLHHTTKDELTPSADVYALAKTVYFMLCGESPSLFKQQQIASLSVHVSGDPRAAHLLRVLKKATSPHPANRHQSVQEFFNDLCGLSEETVCSTRQWDGAASAQRRAQSRIIVEIAEKPVRDYWAETKNFAAASAGHAARSSVLVAECLKALWKWIHPLLRKGGHTLAQVSRYLWTQLSAISTGTLVRVAAVLTIFMVMLVASFSILKLWNSQPFSETQKQGVIKPVGGGEAIANTDINLRSKASGKSKSVGLVEKNSRVRILSSSADQNWCEIEVLQHGREKEKPSSADRGWVNRVNLTFD